MESLPADKRTLLTEKFHALLDGSDIVARNAAHGQALDDLETFFLIASIREVFQSTPKTADQTHDTYDSPIPTKRGHTPTRYNFMPFTI